MGSGTSMGVPTLGYFRDGQLVDRLVGYPGPNGVKAFVEKNASVVACGCAA